MSKKAKITIVLDYDIEALSAMLGREVAEEDFPDEVGEYAFHDLQDLLRTNSVYEFAEVVFTDEQEVI